MTNLIADLRSHPIPFAVGALGFLAALALLLCSTGTNDALTWKGFAEAIRRDGLFALYGNNESFNHPPLMGWLSWLSLELSSMFGLRFTVVFRLFPVLANLAGALVLWSLWRVRKDPRTGALAFGLYGWALCPLLIAAYHGNTDCTAAFFCLWSVYILEIHRRPFLAGLALAAAMNVKIVPILFALPVLAGFRAMKDARAFVLGSATAALPYLVALLGAGTAFVENVFGYGSSPELWGVQSILFSLRTVPGMTEAGMKEIHTWYHEFGKFLLVFAILLLTVHGFRRKLGQAHLMASSAALFLLLTPGFGVQYAAYPAPLLFAVSLARGMQFAVVSGVYIAMVYVSWLVGFYPLESRYQGYDLSLGFLGFGTWLVLLGFMPGLLRGEGWSAKQG